MARGYLLDTNIVRYWFDDRSVKHQPVLTRIAALAEDDPLHVSVITYGEMEYGHQCESNDQTPHQVRFASFIEEHLPFMLEIRRSTTIEYGRIRAMLFLKFAPRDRRIPGLRPEQLIDPVTSREIGVQENDIWLAAQAIEHNLVLVTHDQMNNIRTVAPALRVEDWAQECR